MDHQRVLYWVRGIRSQSFVVWEVAARDFSARIAANTPFTRNDLNGMLQLRMTGAGPYYVPATAIGAAGAASLHRSCSASSKDRFSPIRRGYDWGATRRQFTGPSVFNMGMRHL